jgi:hypothetical protein
LIGEKQLFSNISAASRHSITHQVEKFLSLANSPSIGFKLLLLKLVISTYALVDFRMTLSFIAEVSKMLEACPVRARII